MPVQVDQKTFAALALAEGAIRYARHALPYGSANQYADLIAKRNGGQSGAQSLTRLTYNRDAVDALLQLKHGALPAGFGAPAERSTTYATALSAGISLYYGAGNCDEHAMLTFHFLATFGFPGLKVIYAHSTVMDHAYTVISWEGCKDWVVCDAWPSKPQACLWSQFFGNTTGTQNNPAFSPQIRRDIDQSNMGEDLIGQAFGLLSPKFVQGLPLASRTQGFSRDAIFQWLKTRPQGIYNHQSVLREGLAGPIDFTDGKQLLSQVAPLGEQWTAKLAKVILEVNDQLHVLDPARRYTTSRQAA